MNERIRELERQATDYYSNGQERIFDRQKFAELIVKEVLDEVLQAMDDGMDVYDTVADKFGVEQ
jgi:hypothetical protein